MGRLADKVEEAFNDLDNGDIISFTGKLIDIADLSIQSKNKREMVDGFVHEHFKARKKLVKFIKGYKDVSTRRPRTK